MIVLVTFESYVSDGVVLVGRIYTEGYVDQDSDPAGVLELPRLFCGNSHSDAAFNFCPDVGVVHRLPRH